MVFFWIVGRGIQNRILCFVTIGDLTNGFVLDSGGKLFITGFYVLRLLVMLQMVFSGKWEEVFNIGF